MNKKPTKNAVSQRQWYKTHSNPSGVIYQIRNLVTDTVYVGSTVGPLKKKLWRMFDEAKRNISNRPIINNIRLYGRENFVIEKLEDCEPGSNISQRERYWIKRLDATYLGRGKNKIKA